MDNEKMILEKIFDLKELIEARHDNLSKRLDIALEEINRNKTSISELYKLDRKQGIELNKMIQLHEKTSGQICRDLNSVRTEKAVRLQENMRKLGWKIVVAVVTSAIATYGLTMLIEKLK